MKNNKTREILFHIKDALRTTREIFDILPTYREMRRQVFGHMEIPKFDYKEWQWQEEQKFYALLSKLRKEGLVQKQRSNKKSFWKITKKGLEKLSNISDGKSFLRDKNYNKKKSDNLNLVIFDIPEKLKYKRAWLRKQLKFLGFEMLQKSVWVGKFGIPKELIFDLKDLKMLPYLHIFKIYKKGSLMNMED